MPQIQDYNTRTMTSSAPTDAPRLGAEAFGGAQGRGLESLGGSIADGAQRVAQWQDNKAKEAAQRGVVASFPELVQMSDQFQREAKDGKLPKGEDGSVPYTEIFQERLKKFKEEKTSGVSHPGALNVWSEGLDRSFNGFISEAVHFESQFNATQAVEGLKKTQASNQNILRSHPEHRDTILNNEIEMIKGLSGLDGMMKSKLIQERTNATYDSALDGMVTTAETTASMTIGGVDKLIGNLRDQKQSWITKNSPQMYDSALTRLQKLKEHLSEKNKAELVLDFEERMQQIEVTGKDAGHYTADWIKSNISDPKQFDRMMRRQAAARAVGKVGEIVKTVSDVELVAQLKEKEKKLGGSNQFGVDYAEYKALAQGAQIRAQEFTKDPVGYVLKASERTSNLFTELTKNKNPETAKTFADAAILEQKRLSPTANPRLLPEVMTSQIKAQVQAVTSNEYGAGQLTEILQNEQRVWGSKHWPMAVRDLYGDKAINGTQVVAASLLNLPTKKHIAVDLVRSSVFKESEMLAAIPGERVKAEIESAAVDALKDLHRTMSKSAGGMYPAFREALVNYAIYQGYKKGADPTGDIEKYAQELVLDQYEFTDTYRVPKGVPVGTIENAAYQVKSQLKDMDFVVPFDLYGLDPKDAQSRYMKSIRVGAEFRNTGDDSGLQLIDQIGNQVMVLEDGKPVPLRWTWSELRAMDISNGALREKQKDGDDEIPDKGRFGGL